MNLNTRTKCLKLVNFLLKRNLHNWKPELNIKFICNPENEDLISKNIACRKGVGDIKLVQHLYCKYREIGDNVSEERFLLEALKIPNSTHPEILKYGDEPQLIKQIHFKPQFEYVPKQFHELAKRLNLIRTDQLGTCVIFNINCL